MPNKIILKNSDTVGNTPIATEIDIAELAYNSTDNKLFTKNSTNTVVELTNFSSINGVVPIAKGGIGLTSTPATNTFLIGTGSSYTHSGMTDTLHGSRGGGGLHSLATTSTSGFMSSTDKSKLDGITGTNTGTNTGDQNIFLSITDGTNTASATTKTDTFKLRSADTKLSVVVGINDATHGDNALFTINEANLNLANQSGILPVSKGGTGSSTQNFVDLSNTQTSIAGNKTFTGTLTASTKMVAPTVATNTISTDVATGQYVHNVITTHATSGFGTRSLANPGYQEMPGGLLMQWGSVVGTLNSNGECTFSFPVTFGTFITLTASNGDSAAHGDKTFSYNIINNSSFRVKVFPIPTSAFTVRVNYIAIGT